MNWSPHLDESGPLHRQLFNALERDITSGVLESGTKLPPQRQLADHVGLALGTVTKAYNRALKAGLLEGRVGKGTFVRQLNKPDGGPINMAINIPPASAYENELEFLREAASRATDWLTTGPDYSSLAGVSLHREQLCELIAARGLNTSPKQVFPTVGAQQAIHMAISVASKPGDVVLLEAATFSGIVAAVKSQGRIPYPVDLDEEGINPNALEAAIETTNAPCLVTVPTGQNPTGVTQSLTRRQHIIDIARTKNLLIIEDDISGFLPPERPTTMASLAPERVFYVDSLSKSLWPNLRCGFLVCPTAFAGALEHQMQGQIWSPPTLPFEIALRAWKSGTLDHLGANIRAELLTRAQIAARALDIPMPKHAVFNLWLPMPSSKVTAVVDTARTKGLELTPASAPLVTDTQGQTRIEGLRLCIGSPRNRLEFETGVQILKDILNGADVTPVI
jgi:DNA-binding transcriptional MocR family regulator